MSIHPATIDRDGLGITPKQLAVSRRAQQRADLEVFRYSLGVQARAQIDQMDSEALDDATRTAMECELRLLDDGFAKASGSAAKAAIVARHVERNVAINDRRISQRFGV